MNRKFAAVAAAAIMVMTACFVIVSDGSDSAGTDM